LKDINDNAPLFPHGVYVGNVTENGTAGKNPPRPPGGTLMNNWLLIF